MTEKEITDCMLDCGAFKGACVPLKQIMFNREFRKACEANSCGSYGQCWMCPPDVGSIDELMAKAQTYKNAAVFQTIWQIEDSYDIEGMFAANRKHSEVAQKIRRILMPTLLETKDALLLSAGGCKVCDPCSKRNNTACRHPDVALASLEAYGVSVYETAQNCGMQYSYGQNTVTYFGAILY